MSATKSYLLTISEYLETTAYTLSPAGRRLVAQYVHQRGQQTFFVQRQYEYVTNVDDTHKSYVIDWLIEVLIGCSARISR